MPPLIARLLVIWLSVHGLAWCVERSLARERFKVVIAPVICKRICLKGHCKDTCEQGNNTTLIAENGQAADTLTGQGFRVVVCPLTCMNGGVCVSRKHCHCPPGFTGRLCQFPLTQTQQAQAARGNKQPVYPISLKPDSLKLGGETSIGRTQMTHSVFTLPISQRHHSSEVQINVRVHHHPDTSVFFHPLDQSEVKLPHKTGPRLFPSRHKPKGRCFQETTPKQACTSTPLPVLTNQEDCCGSVGNSWGQNKCYQCPKLPNAPVKQTIVEDYGTNCPQGYKRFNDTHCEDINECSMQGVCQNGDCLNTLGSFKCSCKAGWASERNGCVDLEAPAEQGQCFRIVSESRGCEHALPTYLTQVLCCCTIGKAWGPNCEPCPQTGTVAFSKICPAGKGYFLQKITEIFTFPPIIFPRKDEGKYPVKHPKPPETTTAVQQTPTTTHSPRVPVVKPTPPTIIRLTPDNDPFETQTKVSPGVDECKLNRNICGHGECESNPNGYVCHCHHGYRLNPVRNICEDNNECESEPCGHGRGHCVNTDGSYKCLCRQGYKHMVQSGRPKCIDLNECSKQDICGVGGECINLPGSYQCKCISGFRIKSHSHHVCEDINECLNPDTCPGELCENTVGSYECVSCLPGHEAQGGTCYDINECLKPGMCPNGRCENLPGTYRCLCNEGFLPSSDSKGCSDIDECSLFAEEICKRGHCENTLPGYECYCEKGFYYDSNLLECTDVNECHDESLCANGHCVNTEGSFLCNCNPPWIPDANKKKCVLATIIDVNECEDPANCKNGHCVDTPGSYYCICTPPWTLATDRNSCVTPEEQADVNECQDPSYCKNGRCENTPGSFHCFCDPPLTFSAALKQCVYDDRTAAHKDVCFLHVDEGLICSQPKNDMVVTYSQCCCHYGRGWGPECNTCPPRHSDMFNRLCQMHLETESDGEQDFLAVFANYNPGDSSEEDSDECSCANGRCVRSYLGTMCECNAGFRLDHSRTRCIDIDECAEPGARVTPCKNSRCVNTAGSYKCFCKHGFVPTRRPNICVRRRTR
ncbi:latent-transforming growth factor beta-binding protein 3 isoform X9 [Takifugu rubripes]|uniref:latent-transforming growth factor beta-binding protein 3 isoform X9 n=1 Tax=Takifugu rubripes TaxID=31033 RepID=UPI0011459023|nr:latent-transforming growth factor beta-binding protein 3 isoform X9 [Takifugu rubripes]